MIKKKLAFVDHNFHKKTRSSDFLREIFSKEYEIHDYWWTFSNKSKLINSLVHYDNIFFHQSLIPFYDLKKIRDKNLMWSPMYDNLPMNWTYWKKIASLKIKILSFSRKILSQCLKFNCLNIDLKYFKKPNFKKIINKKDKINIFFWDRGGLKIDDWIHVFDKKNINRIVYLDKPDPGRLSGYLDDKIKKKFKIKKIIISTMKKKNTLFLNYIKNCDVFVCPRKQEGIGMSLVEAIAYGKYTVSYNDATMNEYVHNDKLGLILKHDKQKIKISNIFKFQAYRNSYAISGYNNWLKQKKSILFFFNKEIIKPDLSLAVKTMIFFDYLKHLIKKNLTNINS